MHISIHPAHRFIGGKTDILPVHMVAVQLVNSPKNIYKMPGCSSSTPREAGDFRIPISGQLADSGKFSSANHKQHTSHSTAVLYFGAQCQQRQILFKFHFFESVIDSSTMKAYLPWSRFDNIFLLINQLQTSPWTPVKKCTIARSYGFVHICDSICWNLLLLFIRMVLTTQ